MSRRPRRSLPVLALTLLLAAVAVMYSIVLLQWKAQDTAETSREAQSRTLTAAQQAGDEMDAAGAQAAEKQAANREREAAWKEAERVGQGRRLLSDPSLWEPETAQEVKALALQYRNARDYQPLGLLYSGEPVAARVMVERLSELRGLLDAKCADLTKLTPEGKKTWDTWREGGLAGPFPLLGPAPVALPALPPKEPPLAAAELAKMDFISNRAADMQEVLDTAETWEDFTRLRARARPPSQPPGGQGVRVSGDLLEITDPVVITADVVDTRMPQAAPARPEDALISAELRRQRKIFKEQIQQIYLLSSQWRSEWETNNWEGFDEKQDAARAVPGLPASLQDAAP